MAKDAKTPKKPKKAKGPQVPENAISIAAHPRAAYGVKRAKGIGGLVGLLLVGLLSLQAGAPAADIGLRALIGGVLGYVTFWTLALHTWRHLIVAEARAAAQRARAILDAADESAREPAA
ncbi:MAG: hypothetical protein QOD81_3082 [Solirubrobacteraceae bacterium]|jgi:hypothetical protein|nr:hypothetical protein [Solirubrobacteraceae bacterium]